MITNSIPSFNFIIIEKIIESLFLCLCLLLSFIQVQSLIQLLVNIWKSLLQTLKNTLFSTHFMILHNFCLLFLNWQPVVNISHDSQYVAKCHDEVIKWKHFPRYWPFVRRIHRSPVNSPHKGQWRGALMFPLICAWTNTRANNGEAGDLRRHRAHYDVTVMVSWSVIVSDYKE